MGGFPGSYLRKNVRLLERAFIVCAFSIIVVPMLFWSGAITLNIFSMVIELIGGLTPTGIDHGENLFSWHPDSTELRVCGGLVWCWIMTFCCVGVRFLRDVARAPSWAHYRAACREEARLQEIKRNARIPLGKLAYIQIVKGMTDTTVIHTDSRAVRVEGCINSADLGIEVWQADDRIYLGGHKKGYQIY